MKTKMVSYTPETTPRMSKEDVAALKAKLDDPNFKIDYSDIPPLTEERWNNAKRRGLIRTAATRASNAPIAK